LIVSSLVLVAYPRLGWSQSALRAERPTAWPPMAPMTERIAPASNVGQDSVVSHRQAILIGTTTGVVLGGLGAAAYILNALAPDCVTEVAATSAGPTVLSSHHCTNRSRIVVLQTVTIAAGATAGGFAGAWVARRIADWRDRRHRK
jgi:hypothetical protein